MNVVIYARFSSHSQTEQSIEGQLKVCYEYAQSNGYTVVDEYIDRAQSGTTDNRLEFQRMIADSEKHTFEGVLVYQLDRFARNRYDSAINKSKLKKNGVRVISAKENIADDPSGILVEGVLESMAEYYSAELSLKINRGMAINAEKCLSNGSNPGLGFKVDSDRRFYVDEGEAAIVREIYERYAAGETKTEIIRDLQRRKVKTSLGKEFSNNSLSQLLSNKRYIGVYLYKGQETPGGMPRILDDYSVRALKKAIQEADVAIENLWRAIEQGQSVAMLTERLNQRKAEKEELEEQLAVEQNRNICLTEPQIYAFLDICLPNGPFIPELRQMGCRVELYEFDRHGTNPFSELRMMRDYQNIIKSVSPDVVLTYTIKPNVYGGMACASLGVPYIATITGLGTAVENGGLMQKLTLMLYKRGLRKAQMVFFQNSENRDFMLEHGVIKGAYGLLPGSGVNLERHRFEEYPHDDGTLTLLFIGRLMKDKGIEELIEASTTICRKYSHIKFIAIGGCEEDYKEQFDAIKANCPIQFMGRQSDVHGFIKNSHAVVLPTCHEGMSNVLQEAAASGRPVLASDIPGCRETFEEGVSGFGFRPRDVDSLCEAIEKFIALPYEKKAEMGRAGRAKMEREFNRNIVVQKYMDEIDKIAKEH